MINKSRSSHKALLSFPSRVLEDGHLYLPAAIVKKLRLNAGDPLTASIDSPRFNRREFLKFAGMWRDKSEAYFRVFNEVRGERESFRSRFPKV